MKTYITIPKLLFLLSVLCFELVAKGQTPSFSCYITNEVQISPTVYQFDLFLLNSGTATLKYATGQWGISVNSNVANGGILTASIVAGSTTLSNPAQMNSTVQLSAGLFNIPPAGAPGAGNASLISNHNFGPSSPGTRIATFRITNTVPFTVNSTMNHTFNFVLGPGKTATKIFAYVNGVNTNITAHGKFYDYTSPGTYLNNIPLNPTTPFRPTLKSWPYRQD
jgi:hypothetical protein